MIHIHLAGVLLPWPIMRTLHGRSITPTRIACVFVLVSLLPNVETRRQTTVLLHIIEQLVQGPPAQRCDALSEPPTIVWVRVRLDGEDLRSDGVRIALEHRVSGVAALPLALAQQRE